MKGESILNSSEISKLALLLDNAILEAREVERLTLNTDLSLPDSYLIQDSGISLRLGRGEKQVGFKMGLTSQAKREQMNLDSPIYGVLTDQMRVQDGGVFSLKDSIHPKIEPEVAFVVDKEIRRPLSVKEALQSCSGICSAMEILDSRYLNFKYFSLPDVVADNCSSAYFVLSREVFRPSDFSIDQLANLMMEMRVNGEIIQKASSSAISGNPLQSLVQLTEMISARGLVIPAGSIVLAGAATQAVPLTAGAEVSLSIESLGSVSLKINSEK